MAAARNKIELLEARIDELEDHLLLGRPGEAQAATLRADIALAKAKVERLKLAEANVQPATAQTSSANESAPNQLLPIGARGSQHAYDVAVSCEPSYVTAIELNYLAR